MCYSKNPLRILRFVVFGLIFLAAVTYAVMSLWNWLMPGLFFWHEIGFLQAAGLLILARLLFGGFGRHCGHWHGRRHFAERWAQMSEEEREKFRAGMGGRCGHRAPPPAENNPQS